MSSFSARRGTPVSQGDIVLLEGDNRLDVQMGATVTFSLFLKNAPLPEYGEFAYWEVVLPGGKPIMELSKLEYAHHPYTLTCPPITTLRIMVYDEESILFDRTATGTFEDGYAYSFDCKTLKFEKATGIPKLLSLSLPPSVVPGRGFDMESAWFLPNPWLGEKPVYSFEIIASGGHITIGGYTYDLTAPLQRLQEIANPKHGVHTFRSAACPLSTIAVSPYECFAQGLPAAYWYQMYYHGSWIGSTKEPMAPGEYEIRASIIAHKWIDGYTYPSASYDQGVVGILRVV